MPDPFEESVALLERLVAEVMKETDPTKHGELCEEIFRVLRERERLLRQMSASGERPFV